MAYTTPDKIKNIIRKLPSSITDYDIEPSINKADSYIDAYLGNIFKVPFVKAPFLIQDISTDLAIFFLTESLYSSQMPNLDDYQITRYERSLKMLEDIAKGDLLLFVDGIEVKPISSYASGYATTNKEQIFNYDTPYW